MKPKNAEILSLLGASIILGFVASFTQWGYGDTFSLTVGLANWLRLSILSTIVFAIYIIASKTIASLHGAKSTFKIWKIGDRFLGFKIISFKAGLVIPILFTFLSNGLIKLATIAHIDLEEISHKRVGKRFIHLTDFEIARIHLAGPFACLLLVLILTPLKSFSTLVEIAKLITLYSFIPLSKLDGTRILFGSIPLYLFGLIFTISSLILISVLPTLASIFLALLGAIIILLIYLYRAN